VSNEPSEAVDQPNEAPAIDPVDRVPALTPIRILAADDDLFCIDDACAPPEHAR